MPRFKQLLAAIALTALPLAAQTTPPPAQVSFNDDFQSYGEHKNPPGWVDTSVGSSKPAAGGLFKTWPDPTQGNKATNIVYGTQQSSGNPSGNNPRIGSFSTYTTTSFPAKGGFEYRGRFIRTSATTQSGLTFFSSYPEKDQYYLVGAWPQANGTLTMQLFAFGGGAFTGTVDSGFTPAVNTWYRFFIQSDDVGGATNVRVRFWADGAAEPSTFSIDAKDTTPAHLTAGRIGIWSAVKGDTFVDDLSAKSSIDRTAPVITFRDHDTQRLLDPATLALFKTPAKIDVSIADDLSAIATKSIKLDGADYISGTAIATDRLHTIVVDATDAAGNAAHATLNLLVDQLPPVVALTINNAPFTDGQIFAGDVTVKASVTDSSDVRTVAMLDGTVVALPAPTAEERRHDFKVVATDQVLWSTEVTRSFFVDKSAPVVTILANGRPLGDADTFAQDVTLTFSATDLTLDTIAATLDGAPIGSGFVVTVSKVHQLIVTANDKAGHATTITRSFPLSKTQPEVHLFANGAPFVAGTSFRVPVAFTATMTDPTPTSYVATVDNHDYHLGDTIAGEDHHTITLRVTNAAHLETLVGPHPFTIDLHPPAVTLSEGGAPFEAGKKFTRDVVPVVAATDNFTAAPRRTLLVDGHDYPLDQPIASESADHTIEAIATDDAGNSASVGPFHFVLDKTKPIVTVTDGDNKPFAAGNALFAHAVQLRVTVIDVTNAPPVAAGVTFDAGTRQSDGSVVYLSQPIGADGVYDIAIVATDVVGLANDAVHARFRIDTKPPVITFTAPAENASLGAPSITVAGTSDDAESVTINGRDALVDTTAHTFTIDGVALLEGKNDLVAVAFDKAGNRGSATRSVTLDTSAPQLTVTSPLRDACVRTNELTVSGRASDANLASVKVSIGGTSITATTAVDGSWSATLPLAAEGRVVVTIEAIDVSGHSTTATIPISVDRTVPRIEVSEGGRTFSAGAFNRTLAPIVRVIDEDANIAATITLDGHTFASGASITLAGAHALVVNATDCAGNIAAATSIAFTIDLTPPVFTSFDPADGTTIGEAQATIRGHVDEADLASVTFEGTTLAATIDGPNFTFTNVPLTEGTNRFAVVAIDRAGNRATRTYTLQVKTTAPSVEILDDGSLLVSGRTFTRSVTPVIRANDPAATIAATINGAPFTSGTTIATDGSYSLSATATDSVGHTGSATATFTIDRTAPVVTITSPANDATVAANSIEVRGTFTGSDVASITVNGIDAIRSGNTFVAANITLDEGTNLITATALDNAGNIGEARIEVTRSSNRPGIVLTAPIDKTLTNRSTTAVIGQLLSFVGGTKVTINGSEVAVDPVGVFRKNDFALIEGDNAITAAVAGSTKSVTVHLLADFTPPALTVRANGADLANGARFATAPSIAVSATDANPNVTTRVTIDGVAGTDATSLRDGGHLLTATARDAAGNETRIDRTFFIGAAGAGSACLLSLTAVDPSNFSTILGDHVLLSGRSGGAANVLVNGARASLADGTFSASVQLVEGRNDISIRCADAAGTASGDAITLTLFRLSGSPSVRIITPANESIAAADKITVTGEVGEGVISGDVNGIPFTVPNDGAATHPFSVANVSVVNGLNVIAARARDGAGRTGVAAIHVTRYSAAPRLEITSPIAGTQSGGASIDVSGTYANVDPSTIAIGSAIVTTQPRSDTSGTFTASSVPLSGATTTLTVTARSRANVATTTSVDVLASGGPSITIDAPRDNVAYASTATAPDAITGTINAAGGSTVVVNGVEATITDSHFSAVIAFAANGSTNVVARVAQPDGKSAIDAIRLTKLRPLTIVDSFPAQNATAVDRGALLVILFSNPLDAATVGGALRLVDANGNVITGATFVDSDAVSFAPAVPFTSGGHYTLTISTAAKDIAGQSLQSPFVLTFDAGSLAPTSAPTVDATDDSGCFTTRTIHGTASVAGARIRADVDGAPVATTAAADRSFTLDLNFSGQAGYHTVRVRELGADGALSPERTISYRINCAGPQVTAATLDRAAKTLTITFSKAMKPQSLIASANGTIVLGTLTGTVALDATAQIATITYTASLTTALTLVVTKDVQDATGTALGTDYTQTFPLDDATSSTGGFVTGAVYDATNGRPLTTARIDITPSAQSINVDERGRYSRSLAEGAYTLRASAPGFATVWRQLVVPAGAGVVPIDIRLTKRGSESAAPFALIDSAQTTVTRNVELTAPSASLTPGAKITLTAVGGQSLAGLLPLGWSPLAAAEIAVDGSSVPASLAAAKLTFVLSQADADALTAASQTLSLVTYDVERDEWRVVVAVVPVAADRRITSDIIASGNYALVYPDKAPSLAHPPSPHAGAALQGVANPCTASPDACAMKQTSFPINPTAVLPNQRATATLVTDNTKPYPSGTAVQAYIDEELHLADGRVVVDPPFATDLLIYRTPAGDAGSATFHIAPTTQAASVTLRDGVDHIRVVDYPGRIDRGTLVGAEGGRIPGDEFVSIDVPTGATTEAIHASSRALTAAELTAIPSIAGFHVAGGFELSLTRTTDPSTAEFTAAPLRLIKSARATFALSSAQLTGSGQVIVVELLPSTPYGALARLAARTTASTSPDVAGTKRFATIDEDPALFPVDGIVAGGRYLVLVADAPIAFTWGRVQLGASGPSLADTRVSATPLGVVDLSRIGGLFALPVPATAFTLVPRHFTTGDGVPAAGPRVPQRDEIVPFGVLVLAAQAPNLTGVTPSNRELDPSSPLQVQATFDAPIDPSSATGGILVNNLTTGRAMAGNSQTVGNIVTFTPAAGESLVPASRYAIAIASTIRGTNGAPFGRVASYEFTTAAVPPPSKGFNPSAIRVTIPDAGGVSTITGASGAIPANAIALAVRSGQSFIQQYQTVASTAGAFQFTAGGGDPYDRLTLDDELSLHVIDSISHSTIAIIPLTPFVTPEGDGFVATPGTTSTFTTDAPLSATITVPAGAFEKKTLVRLQPAAKTTFTAVPSLDAEVNFIAGINLVFDGIARVPLELDLPIPAGTPTDNRTFLLLRLGDSSRGPRLEIDDLLRVENGKFTTRAATTNALRAVTGKAHIAPNDTVTGVDARRELLHVVSPARYGVADLKIASGSALMFAAIQGLENTLEIFWDRFNSLYVSNVYITASQGRVVIPIIANQRFRIEGVEAASGLSVFTKDYEPLAPVPVDTATVISAPGQSNIGPYPVFGDPFRVIVSDLAYLSDTTVPGFNLTFQKTQEGSPSTTVLDVAPNPNVAQTYRVLDVTKGTISGETDHKLTVSIGDRVVIVASNENVEPTDRVSIVFNKTLAATTPAQLEPLIKLQQNYALPSDPKKNWVDLHYATYTIDSGRRVTLKFPTELQRGGHYRLVLDATIADTTPVDLTATPPTSPITLGRQTGRENLYLEFKVRAPRGEILPSDQPFTLARGVVRDMALDGNLLFVSSLDGGIAAYDISDPASLSAKPPNTARPIARASAFPQGVAVPGESWAVTVDRHGRVYSTALTNMFGVIRTYRVEQFAAGLDADAKPLAVDTPYASSIIAWRPGINVGAPLGTTLTTISDRAEATPRKLQLAEQDEELVLVGGVDFDTKLVGTNAANTLDAKAAAGPLFGDAKSYTVTVPPTKDFAYRRQRITILNETLGLRWSQDANAEARTSAAFTNVLVRGGDHVRILRNSSAYAVISLFGFGVGVYDLNAVESNNLAGSPMTRGAAEQIMLTDAHVSSGPCDEAQQPRGTRCAVPDLAFGADAVLTVDPSPGGPLFRVFGLDPQRGIAEVVMTPKADGVESTGNASTLASSFVRQPGLPFTGSYSGGDCTTGPCHHDHPILALVRAAFADKGITNLTARFAAISRYDAPHPCTDNPSATCYTPYALVAANQFGILVVDLSQALGDQSLADVIWLRSGAYAVRVIPGTRYATAIDGRGRAMLIDLSRIDERLSSGPTVCPPTGCAPELFPTLARSLAAGADKTDSLAFGTDDPRVIWKSAPSSNLTTLAPVGDPETGFLFNGELMQTRIGVISATDPRVAVKVNLGHSTFAEVSAIVPMGVPRATTQKTELDRLPVCATAGPDTVSPTACRENSTPSVFRVEVTLPGSMSESTPDNLAPLLAIESERLPGALAQQTPTSLPMSHLRTDEVFDLRKATNFTLRHIFPSDAVIPHARLQKGWNRFVTPWVVAMVDPRASKDYQWNGVTPSADGCENCTMPPFLKNATLNTDYFELLTTGRNIVIRPGVIFGGTYQFINENKRLFARVGTVMADTVRPTKAVIAAQEPPVASGQLDSTVLVHSGELQMSSLDLDAGGRAGWDVVFDRTYLSRTLGETQFGLGWDSSVLRRLRRLPNGNVELRDGSGEVRLFTLSGTSYLSPAGYFYKLVARQNGWLILDQQNRVTSFDEWGRLTSESDVFYSPQAGGNVNHYSYDANDQLTSVVDAVGRATTLTWWKLNDTVTGAFPGRLKQISDWRQRTLEFAYDSSGRLTKVSLPQAGAAEGVPAEFDLTGTKRPKIEYTYATGGNTYSDRLELSTNIVSINDTSAVEPRLAYAYDTTTDAAKRDHLTSESWATGERATFVYDSPTTTTSVDILGQRRTYDLTTAEDQKKHIAKLTVHDVPTVTLTAMPATVPNTVPTENKSAITEFAYNGEGQLVALRLPSGRVVNSAYSTVAGVAGNVVSTVTDQGPGVSGIQTTFNYDTKHTTTHATLESVQRGEVIRESWQPSRERKELLKTDETVTKSVQYDASGRPTFSGTIDPAKVTPPTKPEEDPHVDPKLAAIKTSLTYYEDSATALITRGEPHFVTNGESDGPQIELTYAIGSTGGRHIDAVDTVRKTHTHTVFDSLGHRTSVQVKDDDSGKIYSEERFGYDTAGRLRFHSRQQTPLAAVVTTFAYDAMGRATTVTTSGAYVNDSPTTLTARTEWNMTAKSVTRFDPSAGGDSAAREVTLLDTLGRPQLVQRVDGGGNSIVDLRGYDLQSQLAYSSDGVRQATLNLFDGLGRQTSQINSDGTRSDMTWNEWNQLTGMITYDAKGVVIAQSKNDYTPQGRLKGTNEQLDDARVRRTEMVYAVGGIATSTRVGAVGSLTATRLDSGPMRGSQENYDSAGRTIDTIVGETPNFLFADQSNERVFAKTTTAFTGALPNRITSFEPLAGVSYATNLIYDGVGRTTQTTDPGGYVSTVQYDEAGNPITSQRAGMDQDSATFDSRGLAISQSLAGGRNLHYKYDALGNATEFLDEAGESTRYQYDALGRPQRIDYADGSSEETRYESATGAVLSRKTRAGDWLTYIYDNGGRVQAIGAGQDLNAPVIVRYDYDDAGRLKRVRNADAGVAYAAYDLLGQPTITKSYRYAGHTGLGETPAVLDVHTQTHVWTVHGERSSWRMPVAGESTGTPGGSSIWMQAIGETYDAGGNLTNLTVDGATLVATTSRSVGRISGRTRTTGTGATLTTSYGFADGQTSTVALPAGAPPAASGLPLWSRTVAGDVTVAGTSNARDGAKRLGNLLDLGLSNRTSSFLYDNRGRLTQTTLQASTSTATPITDTLIDADFRQRRATPALLSADQHKILGDTLALQVEPPTWVAAKTDSTHRVKDRTLLLDGEEKQVRHYSYDSGTRRTSDGVWTYTFDVFGRVTSASSTSIGRRVEYTWNPANRIVGRSAFRLTGADAWVTEDRANILSSDGLPADATFVWDPVVDRIVAMYVAGASTGNGATADAGLLRQYLHGDRGYDDPIMVRKTDTVGSLPKTYYPVLDETGTGSLTAVAGDDGNMIERVLYADAYGDAPRYLQGPVVDKISIEAKKSGTGAVESIKIRVHLSERIDETKLDEFELTSVRNDNRQAAHAPFDAELEDPYTAMWSLTVDQWTALSTASGAVALEVAVTNAMRAKGWGATPVAPIPTWALRVFSGTSTTATHPVVKREPLEGVLTFISGVAAGDKQAYTSYEMKSLYLAASEESKAKLLVDFHAYPFREPATQLVQARERWLDPATGSWLSADPMGYADSSNLYSFCADDPVNASDPLGLARGTRHGGSNYFGDWGDDTNGGIGFWAVIKNTAGNTVSDLLFLDAWADANVVAWDSSRSGGERAWAATKGIGVAAFDIAGGEILGKAFGPVGRRIAASGIGKAAVAKFLESGLARVLASDVKILAGEALDRIAGNALDDVAIHISSLSDRQLTQFGRIPQVLDNQLGGEGAEALAKSIASEGGESIIESQFQRGAASRGFDFLSFTGEGASARLLINEVKREAGRVGSRRFTTFGLGRSGERTFREAIAVAQQRIATANLDFATRSALLAQLRGGTARIRLIGGRNTIFDAGVLTRIGQRTGFITGHGFSLP
ncbi:MAG: hypothetical protein QOI24_4469 [Acidobacteriota bacterium]|jgi:RHS repeat-associated protein|nr:hypothetical protein [Acidobacteriota bacterium]